MTTSNKYEKSWKQASERMMKSRWVKFVFRTVFWKHATNPWSCELQKMTLTWIKHAMEKLENKVHVRVTLKEKWMREWKRRMKSRIRWEWKEREWKETRVERNEVGKVGRCAIFLTLCLPLWPLFDTSSFLPAFLLLVHDDKFHTVKFMGRKIKVGARRLKDRFRIDRKLLMRGPNSGKRMELLS